MVSHRMVQEAVPASPVFGGGSGCGSGAEPATTMTDERRAPLERIKKGAAADPVRELPAFANERLPRPVAAGRACGDGSRCSERLP